MELSKKEIRQEVKRRISALTDAERSLAATTVTEILLDNPRLREARCIALFASMEDEISTAELIKKLAQQATVALPHIEGDEMQFFAYRGELKCGKFGIAEPTCSEPILPAEIDVMILPARAFSASGERLGRGKGFYDKYLSHSDFRAYTIGIGFACQLFDLLPAEAHDRRVDLVVTA